MLRDLGSRIEDYARAVAESLPLYVDHDQLVELFLRRESIEDELGQETVAAAAEKTLEEADRGLVKRSARLRRRFPEVFIDRPPDVPRRYWWWYLDEKAQPRGQRLASTTS